jgi:cytochrome c oxidase subunit II
LKLDNFHIYKFQLPNLNNTRTGKHLLFWLNILILTSCSPDQTDAEIPNLLDPKGPVARIIATEWWIQFALGMIVFLVVTGLLFFIIYVRSVRGGSARDLSVDMEPTEKGRSWIWIGGVIVPVIILTFLFGVSIYGHISLASPDIPPAVRIEVIGHRWWWEVHYLDEGLITANEIHIPVGEPVEFHLTSRDVIHSFWIPQLAGKLDMNPGQTNSMWLQADEAGIYRGICAEFCGLQHARMQFMVVAESREDYEAWVERELQPAPEPDTDLAFQGQQVFMETTCHFCHTVRGTNASGEVGPDLTHIASRLTLAAGSLQNNRGNMGGWIMDPQSLKPGVLMPPTDLTGEELQALLAYLDTLR